MTLRTGHSLGLSLHRGSHPRHRCTWCLKLHKDKTKTGNRETYQNQLKIVTLMKFEHALHTSILS